MVCAELECFDADHSHSGNGISSKDQAGLSAEKQRSGAVVINGAQAEIQVEPDSTPVDESCDGVDGDLENRSTPRPPIARIWWGAVIAVLLLIGSPWHPGEFDESISRIVMAAVFSSMVAGAALIYWVLSSMFPGGFDGVRDDGELSSSDPFDLMNWRDGRVPRYMDETDPASGPLWVGNRLHEQVMKDQADRRAR